MAKYNQNAKCPKCGHKEVIDSYYEKDEPIWGDGDLNRFERPVIKRTCQNCNFYWFELPLDYTENETEANDG